MATLAPLMNERTKLEMKIQKLRMELAEIDQAAKAIGVSHQTAEVQLTAERRKTPTPTIKQAVLSILAEHPSGLTALDILALINRRFDLAIVRTSLSPQLSRLKQDHEIENDGSLWRIIEQKKARPNEPGSNRWGRRGRCLRNVQQRLPRGSTPPASTQPYSYI
jgi:hypothetical protein